MRRIAIMLAVTLALPVVVSPAVAYADCNLAVAVPNHASDARGVAFVGRFLGGERGAKPGIRRLTFSTSQRYGLGAGSTVTSRGDVCGIAGSFTAGRRHFVSTAERADRPQRGDRRRSATGA